MSIIDSTIKRLKQKNIRLPTFSELENPDTIPKDIIKELETIHPDEPHPLNLFRIHWYNSNNRYHLLTVPEYIVLPESLTGVKNPIIVVFGENFPLINAHKVLAAYGCLVPKLVNGEFEPTNHRALWPSTGNYCRGGVAVSKIMGCRGVAILPENMSKERYQWLEKWVTNEKDIIKTSGSESNVKEIYDKCQELQKDTSNVIFNQFREFGNALVHYKVTGKALGEVYLDYKQKQPKSSLFGFVSATGSAGTISAGDRLKEDYGCQKIGCIESLECPTLLYNGFGEHNIQGIGDKHLPYIHNVLNTDNVIGITDKATDTLSYLFNHPIGKEYLNKRRKVPLEIVNKLSSIGYSGIANILGAIKMSKYYKLNENQVIMTVATDGASLYKSDNPMILDKYFNGYYDMINAGEIASQYLYGCNIEHLQELSYYDRERIFNLGYYTWVEQQHISVEEFEQRRNPEFWKSIRTKIDEWDKKIIKLNETITTF